jgi:5-methylthioribose kinase
MLDGPPSGPAVDWKVQMTTSDYSPLTEDTLRARIGDIDRVANLLGGNHAGWDVREVGDGNLNLVFIVVGSANTLIVKQALPYVRMVGESWPLPLYRATFEHHALVRQAKRDPGAVPEVIHFDRTQALIVMEFLSPHVILRTKLINGERVEGLGEFLGLFCARTAFRGSELSMAGDAKKADVGVFSGNVAIPAITEALVFTDPYYNAEMNAHNPVLDPVVARLRGNIALKVAAQQILQKFASNTETMVHGDLHSGSVMCTDNDSRVIDPEFAQYGPIGFDIGMLIANFLMSYFSQPAHRNASDLAVYQDWLMEIITTTINRFNSEFTRLWNSERTGMLYPAALFEDQGHSSGPALDAVLSQIWEDALGVCGIEMHRRVLSLAHNADFESIANPDQRGKLEARNLMMGQDLLLGRIGADPEKIIQNLAARYNKEKVI